MRSRGRLVRAIIGVNRDKLKYFGKNKPMVWEVYFKFEEVIHWPVWIRVGMVVLVATRGGDDQ